MLTPSYSCHCVMNSSARLRSPLNMRGVFPTNLSFLPPPPTTGVGGMGAGGPPPGGPPPGGPNGPPGGPPLGGPLPGGPPLGGPPPPYIYLPGSGILLPCGLIHPNGMCVVRSVPLMLGGSGWSGPIARNNAASSASTWPVTGLIVPAGTSIVRVLLIGSLMFRDSAREWAIS
jgi:hypothetical protein